MSQLGVLPSSFFVTPYLTYTGHGRQIIILFYIYVIAYNCDYIDIVLRVNDLILEFVCDDNSRLHRGDSRLSQQPLPL